MTPSRRPVVVSSASLRRRGGGAGEPAAHPVPPLTDLPLLLDSRELARQLGIGRTKAFQLMLRGDIPVVRIGRSVRVARTSLESWIRLRELESDPAAALN